jgi:uncharacterized protein (TIGR00255 family)
MVAAPPDKASPSLASMTGYGRAAGSLPGVTFSIEIKSVNGRGLDLRLRLASGFDALEAEIRRRISSVITRGSLAVSLSVEREGQEGRVVVNHQALEAVLEGLDWIKSRVGDAAPPRLDGLLALKGVLEQHQIRLSDDEEEALNAAILVAVDQAVAALQTARREEGGRIATVLSQRIDEIAALAQAAENHPSRSREAILLRLRQQIADLSAASGGLSEERLAQEAVLLATKADIREELDRLGAHIEAAHRLIKGGGPVGRKLDFLSQEFNREANTLCAKSNDVKLTAIGLDLKAVIDQLREQVQNIE